MSKFLDRFVVRKIEGQVNFFGGAEWELHSLLRYKSDILRRTIVIPPGFKTDFATSPVLNNNGQAASVVHDFLCGEGVVPRAIADQVYREALEVEGVSKWRRNVLYSGARFGGFIGIGVRRA